MTFLEAANSSYVYYVVLSVLAIVLAVLVAFFLIAVKEAKRLNMTNKEIGTIVKTTTVVSIGPSLSVLVPFLTLMALLGVPWSWLRLSVIGSAPMEMTYANAALAVTGFESLGVETSMEGFCICALAIGFTCIAGILINVFFNKMYSQRMEVAKAGKNAALFNAIFGAFFTGIVLNFGTMFFVNFIPAKNYTPIAVFITGLLVCFIGDKLVEKSKSKKIREFTFAIYLFITMFSAIIWSKIF